MKFPFVAPSKLRELGVIGINMRNHDYISKYNKRKFFPLVDDKLKTKKLALENGLCVPELYAVIPYMSQMKKRLSEVLQRNVPFVIKPAHGSGGNGILVIKGIFSKDELLKSDNSIINIKQVYNHISNILSGLYSLGGKPDMAMIEYCVQFSDIFSKYSYQGVPDIRIIIFQGFPVMAMIRLATKESDGRANLHQGAVGVGIDIKTGKAISAVHHNRRITHHPDTKEILSTLEIPDWNNLLKLATKCYAISSLGYIGADIVIDKNYGAMVLEMNARPGLAIQIANGCGLLHRLQDVEKLINESKEKLSEEKKIEYSQMNFSNN